MAFLDAIRDRLNQTINGAPNPGLSPEEQASVSNQRRQALAASLLQSAAPRPVGTGNFLGDLGAALNAGNAVQSNAANDALRARLLQSQLRLNNAQALHYAQPSGGAGAASPIGKLYEDLQQAQARGDTAQAASIQSMITRELGSRVDFQQLVNVRNDVVQSSKPYLEAQQGFNRVQVGAKSATAAGDMALIFGYMKTLDPTSTVREGEAASVQNAGNIPDRIIGLYNSILKGQRLSPDQRADFLAQAQAQFGKIIGQQKRVLSDATDFAKRHELDVQDIVPGYVVPTVDYSTATGQSPEASSDPLRINQIGAELGNLAKGVRNLITGGKKVAEMSNEDIMKGLGLPP